MSEAILSLAEIAEIERSYALGVPALGRAAGALLARWRLPLRDEETFVRLAFPCWCEENEPEWLTGLEAPLPSVAQLLAERGGESTLSAEALFILGLLRHPGRTDFVPLARCRQPSSATTTRVHRPRDARVGLRPRRPDPLHPASQAGGERLR